jgi:uncharacterized protein (DUF58 family)
MMTPPSKFRFLDPAGLARVGNLELVARQVVEGFLTGRHRSPYHGFSVEYLDHRAYSPGDELRHLDWKIFARTDKYYVKLFQDETNLRAYILLDCSRSMTFSARTISKLEYGSFMAATLTHLMLRQNDAVGLVLFDSQVRQYLPPKARPTQFRRVLRLLEDASAGEETALGPVLHEVADRIRKRGLVILISDLLDDPESTAAGLQHFRHDKHEVIVFHVIDDAELTFPYERLTTFRDLEGAGRVVVNPKSLRERYLERLESFIEKIRLSCFDRNVDYNMVNTSEPYDLFLAHYLDKRKRLG